MDVVYVFMSIFLIKHEVFFYLLKIMLITLLLQK